MTPFTTHAATGREGGLSEDVWAWRRSRLLEAGFPAALAETVASDPWFDLHALLQLVDAACPPDLAVRIVAPVRAGVTQ